MGLHKAITNHAGQKDDELITTANSAITGLTDNADFTFTTELTSLVAVEAIYVTKLGLVATGGKTAVTAKDVAKENVETALDTISLSVNIQANGNLGKLQTTGLQLAIVPSHHAMGVPSDFEVERSNIAGDMVVSVANPAYTTHGTIIAFWKPSLGATPASINDWFFRHSNGHSFTITGLTPNTPYPFAAAYKGNDGEALVWTDITTKSPGD